MKKLYSAVISLSLALAFALCAAALTGENYALFSDTSNVKIPINEHLSGDANGDGKINIIDAIATLRYCTGNCKNTLRDGVDANGDGVVSALDVALVLRHLLGNEVGLGEISGATGVEATNSENEVAFEIFVVKALSNGDLFALDTNEDGIFLGWFASEEAAMALDTNMAVENGFEGDVFGAFIHTSLGFAETTLLASEPYGIRFVSKLDKATVLAIEKVNAANRSGRNGTLTPQNEWKNGIGYGTALSIELVSDAVKRDGTFVKGGTVVPAVYTYSESENDFTFSATVIGVDTAQMADKIAARPYVTYVDANGTERTVYASGDGESLYNVAMSALNAANATDGEKAAANELLLEYANGGDNALANIAQFNLLSEEGSADNDNAYVELDKTTLVALTEDDHSRYRNAFYPRITRVREDLYLMTFNYSQTGQHIYYTTSTDGINWGNPAVLYGATSNKFTYESGSLASTTDSYYGTTADHVALKDGRILCVYSRRPCKGYSLAEYTSINSIDLIVGTVKDGTITWSAPTTIYRGQNWEPDIIERQNGDIEVYWSHSAPMIYKYGFHSERRSSGVAMITSSDGGNTWTPVSGEENLFSGKRIYQYSAGKFTVSSGKTVNFYHGQMPGVAELVDGRMMVVGETRPIERSYHMISMARSNADGTWTELGIDEAGPNDVVEDMFDGAGPTLMRFDSGELLLTYNTEGALFARVLDKTGSNAKNAFAYNALGTDTKKDSGFWSASAPVDSHTAILSMSYKKYNGRGPETIKNEDGSEDTKNHNTTLVGKVRLNHTINAAKKNAVADGNLQEWKTVTDALFVGSLSSVQATYRFAYDDEYVYVAIDRTDDVENGADTAFVALATKGGVLRAELGGKNTLPNGVSGAYKPLEGGTVYEFCFDRAALGLTDSSIRVYPGFTDADAQIEDTIDGAKLDETSTWIKINLK